MGNREWVSVFSLGGSDDNKADDEEMGDIDYFRSEVGEEPEPGNCVCMLHWRRFNY